MRYISTRNNESSLSAAEAIACGLSREGGLFVPDTLPVLTGAELTDLGSLTYQERAVRIMGRFLEDFSGAELERFAAMAYGSFDVREVAPVRTLRSGEHFLELWHGPTCAFKDMALQILPHLLTASMRKTGMGESVCILVATSGDTGKAALEGFRDVENTKIMVFYPENGVSDIQKLQMTSQEGGNVDVCAIRGNFDDAQSGVKRIFSDGTLREELKPRGWTLSSANSINWGRLLPQIVYYFSAYCDLVNRNAIKMGEKVNFCVPTGNFGDILAGYYAKRMGLPVGTLLCASNANNVLTDFLQTGVYDRNRPFHTTISPSMDILVSSNLERLLYMLSDGNDRETASYMEALRTEGRYRVSDVVLERIRAEFAAGFCDDGETKAVIRDAFRKDGYLIDPHTAVACGVLRKYREETGDGTPSVVVSTASPFKFCGSVLEALGNPSAGGFSHGADGTELIAALERESGVTAPAPLKALLGRTARFTDCVDKDRLLDRVRGFLR